MLAKRNGRGDGFRHQDGSDGQTVGQWLGQRHDVGRDGAGFVRPEMARAAQATLDFVEDEGGLMLAAQIPQTAQELRRADVDAAFSLCGLNDHGAGGRADLLARRRQIVERRESDARQERSKWLPISGLVGNRQRAHGTAVEAAVEGEDLNLVFSLRSRPLAGKLERALDSLGA